MKKLLFGAFCCIAGSLAFTSCFSHFEGKVIPESDFQGNYVVDLGLSVNWTNRNADAASVWDTGSAYTPNNLATYEVGANDSCRLPTADEVRELIDKCEWERVMVGENEGLLVVGPNKNKIFLPARRIYRHPETYALDGFCAAYATYNGNEAFGAFGCDWSGSDGYKPHIAMTELQCSDESDPATLDGSDTLTPDSPALCDSCLFEEMMIRLVMDRKQAR